MGIRAIPIETINQRLPKKSLLTAISYLSENHVSKSGIVRRKVLCKCKCGNEKTCIVADLLRGNPISCGCANRGRKSTYKFGDAQLYKKWYDMRERCYNHKNPSYKGYGAIGVTVCDEWKNSYESFAKWSLKNGYSPELQIDKDIKGNGKLYSPETCSIVEPAVNLAFSKNRTATLFFMFRGKRKSLIQICKEQNISYFTVNTRLHRNPKMSIYQAVKPTRYNYKNKKP